MLRSAAEACGGRVLIAMLTGMGHDGLAGTSCVIEKGGAAIAQAGLCHAILPLPDIAPKLRQMLRSVSA